MMSLSAAILVATCTATFGLHSSSSTTNSYSYLALASALRNLTASSAELRPPMPLTETPPVRGPMKPTLTLSLACALSPRMPTLPASSTAVRSRSFCDVRCLGDRCLSDMGRPCYDDISSILDQRPDQ